MIKSLAKSRIKYNKSRTILTVIAIMLTTTLLMGVGTCAVGLIDMQRQQAAASGNVHATFKFLTKSQVLMLKNHVDIEALEINEIFAPVEYGRMNGYLTYGSCLKEGIYHSVGNIIEGHYAETADEICGPKAFFEHMGTQPVIGNKIMISFRPNGEGEIVTREFTICGIVSQIDVSELNISDSRIVYSASVSDAIVNEYISPEQREYSAYIRVFGEESLNYDEIKAKIEAVAEDIGCDKDDINFNSEYLFTMTDPGTEMAGIVFGIAFIIIIFSGLVIYSIYYVSVITDVQEIGKLKALGASEKQVKSMLLTEGINVAFIAIPPGLILGYVIPYFIMPAVIRKAVETVVTAVSIEKIHMFSPPVVLVVTTAVLITVYISLLKPMHMAAGISPVEAIRYQESNGGRKMRKGNININLFRLSRANLTRNKKRTVVTMLTMGLSCVLFMSLAGVMNSMSKEDIARRNIETGDFRLELDFAWNDKEYPENNFDSLQQQNIFSDDFVKSIESIDGVKNVVRRKAVLISSDYGSELFEEGRRIDMQCIDREMADSYVDEVRRGEIDYDKMIEENGVIFTGEAFWDEYGLSIGDTISLTVYDGDRRIPLNVKVMASISEGMASYFLIPKEVYEGLEMQYDSTTDLYVSVQADKYYNVKAIMQEITDSNERFRLYSLDEEMEIGGMSVNMIKYPMYVILIMVAVIGFMNLINTMVTGIVTRRRELGVLQAIGLSDGQLTKMLAGEGMVFTVGTLLTSVTLGNLFGYIIFLKAKSAHFMSVSAYHYPVWETVILVIMLGIGQLAVTYFINKWVHGESLIERIRGGE